MQPRRILLLAHNIEDSGTYNRFWGFARHLARQGHETTLVAASAQRRAFLKIRNQDGARLIMTPTWLNPRLSNGGLAPEDVVSRLALVFDPAYDIVHASEHRPAASFLAMLISKLRKTVMISDWADLWGRDGIMEERRPLIRKLFSGLETTFERNFHRSAGALTVICHDLYDRGRRLGFGPDRLLNLPNGVDLDECHPVSDPADGRRRLGLPDSGRLLVYTGQAPVDMDLLWSAFYEIHKSHRDVRLVVLGRKWQLPKYLGEATGKIIQMGMLPWRDYYLTLACADVLLFPYRNTSRNRARWPGKLSFYMGAGRPIVTNPTGDIRSLFEQNPIGILAGEEPSEFAEATGRLLDDPQLADELGQNARELAETAYAWPLMAAQLSAFYERVLSNRDPIA